MRTRWLQIDELSRERVAELRYFCLQYPEKKAKLHAVRAGFNAFSADGQPRGQGKTSNPTEHRALQALDSAERRDVELVEAAAAEATRGSKALMRCLLKNVTEGVGVKCLAIPMGLRQYYALRRHFYRILDEMQRGTHRGG